MAEKDTKEEILKAFKYKYLNNSEIIRGFIVSKKNAIIFI